MKPSPTTSRATRTRPRRRGLLALAAALALATSDSSPASALEPVASGPTVVLGYSGDEDGAGVSQDLALASVGWKWRFDGADFLDDFFAKGRINFSCAVEPLVGGVFGDSRAFEASAVPYFQLRPLGWEGRFVPFFEGGIGLAYTGLRDYGLGSRVQFSDNVGLGVAIDLGDGSRVTIGYRFRHLSHAGIWGDRNEGLNAHFLAVTME